MSNTSSNSSRVIIAKTGQDIIISSTQNSSQVSSGENAVNMIWIYFGAIVFVVGVVGNVLILAVATRKQMRGTSTSNYLTIMAIGDLVLLFVGILPGWLQSMGIFNYVELSPIACKIDRFCKYAIGDFAIYIILLFSLHLIDV